MKIQNINLFKSNFNTYNKQPVSNFKTLPLKYDSVSFMAKFATNEQVNNFYIEAQNTLKQTQTLEDNSKMVLGWSKDALDKSKTAFVTSLNDINAIKKMPSTGMLMSPKGNIISFSFEVKDEVLLQYSESTPDGTLIKLVTAKDFVPVRISEFKGKHANIYDYKNDTVLITEHIKTEGKDFGHCSGLYTFKNGVLERASVNGNPVSQPSRFDEVYFFNNSGKLALMSIDATMYSGGHQCANEFLFDKNGNLVIAFENYQEKGVEGSIWDSSIHFLNGKPIAKLQGCQQPRGLDRIYFKDALYQNPQERFMQRNDSFCKIDEFNQLHFAF